MECNACGWIVFLDGSWTWLSPALMNAVPPLPTPASVLSISCFLVDYLGTWYALTLDWFEAVCPLLSPLEAEQEKEYGELLDLAAAPPGMPLDVFTRMGYRLVKRGDGYRVNMAHGGALNIQTMRFFPGPPDGPDYPILVQSLF